MGRLDYRDSLWSTSENEDRIQHMFRSRCVSKSTLSSIWAARRSLCCGLESMTSIRKIWWFLTKWIAPVGPLLIRGRNQPLHDGHHYDYWGIVFAIRKKEP